MKTQCSVRLGDEQDMEICTDIIMSCRSRTFRDMFLHIICNSFPCCIGKILQRLIFIFSRKNIYNHSVLMLNFIMHVNITELSNKMFKIKKVAVPGSL